mmetsp:Transcript_5850/g.9717  ORF Transcript_5850/g.9717 Transcript_5850/m.9717 type:complete len:201 (+) Transcript_5850:167-769(+)
MLAVDSWKTTTMLMKRRNSRQQHKKEPIQQIQIMKMPMICEEMTKKGWRLSVRLVMSNRSKTRVEVRVIVATPNRNHQRNNWSNDPANCGNAPRNEMPGMPWTRRMVSRTVWPSILVSHDHPVAGQWKLSKFANHRMCTWQLSFTASPPIDPVRAPRRLFTVTAMRRMWVPCLVCNRFWCKRWSATWLVLIIRDTVRVVV